MEFGGFDVAQNLLRQSEWGRAHEGTWTEILGEGVVGIPAGFGVAKGIGKLAKKYDVAKTIFGRAHEAVVNEPSIATIVDFDLAKNKLASVERKALKRS